VDAYNGSDVRWVCCGCWGVFVWVTLALGTRHGNDFRSGHPDADCSRMKGNLPTHYDYYVQQYTHSRSNTKRKGYLKCQTSKRTTPLKATPSSPPLSPSLPPPARQKPRDSNPDPSPHSPHTDPQPSHQRSDSPAPPAYHHTSEP
jgi:hypothetical protein